MLSNISAILAWAYVPLMWLLAVVLLGLGAAGTVAPSTLRRVMDTFTRNGPTRMLGVVLLVVGMQMFIHARHAATPALVKTLGVLLFLDGGVRVFVPTLSVIFVERLKAMEPFGLRCIGLAQICAAWLFYLAAKLPPPPPVD